MDCDRALRLKGAAGEATTSVFLAQNTALPALLNSSLKRASCCWSEAEESDTLGCTGASKPLFTVPFSLPMPSRRVELSTLE